MSNKNTLKHQRTVELPFTTEEGKTIDIKFSASREQVNEIRLLLGTNEENVKKNYSEIHNTLLDWCDETQAADLLGMLNDEDNFTLQLEIFQLLLPLFAKNKTGLGKPRVLN